MKLCSQANASPSSPDLSNTVHPRAAPHSLWITGTPRRNGHCTEASGLQTGPLIPAIWSVPDAVAKPPTFPVAKRAGRTVSGHLPIHPFGPGPPLRPSSPGRVAARLLQQIQPAPRRSGSEAARRGPGRASGHPGAGDRRPIGDSVRDGCTRLRSFSAHGHPLAALGVEAC